MTVKTRHLFYLLYLAGLSAFAPFATDIYLASMPTIQTQLHASTANVQLTLSLFFLCFAFSQLAWGPLSDRIGRRTVVLVGVSIFILGSLFSAWSQSISQLIIARMIQALGACSGSVMAIAIVKDRYPDSQQMSKVLSVMMSITIIAPMLAPIVGSYLLVTINWQSNFYFVAIYGAILLCATLFTKESYPASRRKPLPINRLCHAYKEQLRFAPFLLAALATSTNFSSIFAFISSSSFIYIKIYQLPAQYFGYFFAFNATALILGTTSLRKLKVKFKDAHIIFAAITICLVGSLIMLTAVTLFPNSIFSIAIPCFIITYGVGTLYPELMSYALKNVVSYTGITSSLAGTSRFLMAAAIGSLMGFLITNSALPLVLVMFGLNILTLISVLVYFKKQAT